MTDGRAFTKIVASGITTVGAAVLTGVMVHAGQATPVLKSEDVLPALLDEVKGLRAAMEQMASAGPRIQLFVGRLQLQETRINGMIRRLDAVRDSLAAAQAEAARVQSQQGQLEAVLAEQRAGATPEAREEAKQAEFMLGEVRRQATAAKTGIDRFTAEEAQLTQDLATEQARWTDISQRLDELERALMKR